MKNFLGVLVIIGIMGIAYAVYSSPKVGVLQKSNASKEPPIEAVVDLAVVQESVNTSEVSSPDGSMKITMKKTQKSDGSNSYSFFVSGENVDSSEIYSKILTSGRMSIPLNSWAPDNKHLFIIHNDGLSNNYLVFKATGEVFADGAAYIDFKSHYALKMKDYMLRDVTGWDAPDLLHIRTSGPPYWFELGSNAFYRLVQR